jgi:hypothetical protein
LQELRFSLTEILRTDPRAETLRALSEQLGPYVDTVTAGRPEFSQEDTEYLKKFLTELMAERSIRAAEAESPRAKVAAEIANRLNPYPLFALLCVDGRVSSPLVYMMVANMKGGAIQTPAGDTNDFVRSETGALKIRDNANIAQQLEKLFRTETQIAEILDSHLGCAARGEQCRKLGQPTDDGGLFEDVIRKRGMAQALRDHVTKHHPGKEVLPIQISFDPHTGYAYMGLETEAAVEAGMERGEALAKERRMKKAYGMFDDPTLRMLTERKLVISTHQVVQEEPFRTLFEQHASAIASRHSLDFRDEYANNALSRWQAVESMRDKCLPALNERLQNIPAYTNLPPKELEQRSMLLLANAFNAFCNNFGHDHYPFAHHKERFASVTERDIGPHRNVGFAVYTLDRKSVSGRVAFAAGIVRDNRANGRVDDDTALPVPIIAKEIIRDELTEGEWARVRAIDWSFLQKESWFTMSDEQFESQLLNTNPSIRLDARVVRALKNLRQSMCALYDPTRPSSEQLLGGNMFALPILSDSSRRFRAIVPFHLKGF